MKQLFLIIFSFCCLSVFAQEGQLQKHPVGISSFMSFNRMGTMAQGSACYGNYYFQCYDHNQQIGVYDLRSKRFVAEMKMNECGASYHCNNANFGSLRYSKFDEFPLLYISQESREMRSCLVYRIQKESDFKFKATLVQTINFPDCKDVELYYPNCFIDKKTMYVMGYATNSFSNEQQQMKVLAFDLPDLSYKECKPAMTALRDSFSIPAASASQGGVIRNERIYQVYGDKHLPILRVINLKSRKVEKIYDLAASGMNYEMENIFWYDNHFYLATNGSKCSILKLDLDSKKAMARGGNPVFPGQYADPEAAIFNNTYWIFPTTSIDFDDQLWFDAFSSKDLQNWTKHENVLVADSFRWAHRALWAPSVIEKEGKYYFFFAANDMKHFGEGGIGIGVADKPEGPYADYLGRPLIQTIINRAQPIDQQVFQLNDSTYYMYYGGWGHCNVVKLARDFKSIVPFEDGEYFKEITPSGYTEGPFMMKKDGKYYFMWSEGQWRKADYRVAYAISNSPLGPFKKKGVILSSDDAIGTGAGHHSVIKIRNRYFIVYHRHPLGTDDGNNRVVCIDELLFDKEGNILPVKMTYTGVNLKN